MKANEIFESVKVWMTKHSEARRRERMARRKDEIVRESERILQAREFDGELFLCFNNVPLVSVADAGDKSLDLLLDLLEDMRSNYASYMISMER